MAYLQLFDKTTRELAENNALYHQVVYPARGLIYDRNNELLVYNQPIYDVQVVIREMGKEFDTINFCHTLQIERQQFEEYMRDMRQNLGFSKYTPQILLSQLGKSDIAPLQEELYRYPGVYIQERTMRDYTYNAAAHVLGSVGQVNQNDLKQDEYYRSGDFCGRDGIEKAYERLLRGEKGARVLMRDSKGRLQGSYKNGEKDIQAQSGEDLQLTLDIQLQLLAEKLMRGKIGSVVAIEPQTGEILALVSSPTWNPKMLVGRQRGKNYNTLKNDPTKPLMNRATQSAYPPGSTFKTIQALVCLQEEGIYKHTEYPCSGPQSAPIKCTHHHGSPVSIENAIEQSCNPFFWCAFRDMLQKNGYGKNNELFKARYNLWRQDIMKFGLGAKFSDSDVRDQVSGNIPSAESYDKIYGSTGWKALTIRSLSIGQGEILVTPLQLANQVSTIANEGYFITPHLLKNEELKKNRHETGIKQEYFTLVKNGMHRVMTNGTGRRYNIEELNMCGKTGTVQNPHGKDHAIFIGFAPMDNPQIAVAVVVENAGFGATWAAPIASLIIENYLTHEISREELYQRMTESIVNSDVQTWE